LNMHGFEWHSMLKFKDHCNQIGVASNNIISPFGISHARSLLPLSEKVCNYSCVFLVKLSKV
jgi:hypothetical protein